MAYTNPYEQKIIGLEEQKRTAEKLREMGMDTPQGQMVSGIYVAPSWTQYMSQALKQGMGAYQAKKAEEGIKAAGEERQAKIAEYLKNMPTAQQETTLETPTTDQQQTYQQLYGENTFGQIPQVQGAIPEGQNIPIATTTTKEPTLEDYARYAMQGQDLSPEAANLAMGIGRMRYESSQAEQARKEKMQERRDELARKAEEDRIRRQEMFGQQESMARLAASLRPAPQPQAPVAVMGPDGQPVYVAPSQAYGARPYEKGAAGPTQHISDAKESNALLDQVEKVGPIATSSGIGAARDYALGLIGQSTEAANASASMKVLGASLTAKVPKMTGPQSDKDVAMYKEAAGNIADPMIPWSRKQAAIKTIREINNRQLSYGNNISAPTQNNAAPVKRFNPATGRIE